jgi:hypothetical protein
VWRCWIMYRQTRRRKTCSLPSCQRSPLQLAPSSRYVPIRMDLHTVSPSMLLLWRVFGAGTSASSARGRMPGSCLTLHHRSQGHGADTRSSSSGSLASVGTAARVLQLSRLVQVSAGCWLQVMHAACCSRRCARRMQGSAAVMNTFAARQSPASTLRKAASGGMCTCCLACTAAAQHPHHACQHVQLPLPNNTTGPQRHSTRTCPLETTRSFPHSLPGYLRSLLSNPQPLPHATHATLSLPGLLLPPCRLATG